jgi:ABC-type enterochelin transport system substrate-binding protein
MRLNWFILLSFLFVSFVYYANPDRLVVVDRLVAAILEADKDQQVVDLPDQQVVDLPDQQVVDQQVVEEIPQAEEGNLVGHHLVFL